MVQCTADASSFEYDEVYDSYTLIDGSSPTANTELELSGNTFTGNIIGKDKHVLSIEGISKVSLASVTFTANENYLPQLFNALSPLASLISSQPATVTSLDFYDYKAQAIVRVACSEDLSISDTTFSQNWIADHQSYLTDYQGILLIQDLTGDLVLSNVLWSEHVGVQSSTLADIDGDGARTGMLVFKDVKLS